MRGDGIKTIRMVIDSCDLLSKVSILCLGGLFMYIYVNNYLIAENQPEQLKGLIAEIGKKSGIRVIVRQNYVSFAPPVSKFLVDLTISANLKELGDSIKERLTISGFTTEPLTKEQLDIYQKKIKEVSLSIREGKPGIFWRGSYVEKNLALLLQEFLDLKELTFEVIPLQGGFKKQIILQGDKGQLIEAEEPILEWFLFQARTDREVPVKPTIETEVNQTAASSSSQAKLPDPLDLLDKNQMNFTNPAPKKKTKQPLDPELSDLPLGDNILDFLSTDDPRAKQLQDSIKKFYEGSNKPVIPQDQSFGVPPLGDDFKPKRKF